VLFDAEFLHDRQFIDSSDEDDNDDDDNDVFIYCFLFTYVYLSIVFNLFFVFFLDQIKTIISCYFTTHCQC
jgi:hypothetical protein